MAKFTDGNGDEWTLNLNVGIIEDIKEQAGVDLDLIAQTPEKIAEVIISAPNKLVTLYYVAVEEQIQKRNLTPRQFAKLFDRQTLDNAGNALLEALLSFYPRNSAGEVFREKLPLILAKMDKAIGEHATKLCQGVLFDTPTSLRG
jgi:hypothetical protein